MNTGKTGFTLLELVVAMAITVVLALFAFDFADSSMKAWRISNSSLNMNTDAQTALDEIQRDLESAQFRETGEVMFAVDVLQDKSNSGIWFDGDAAASRPTENAFDPANHRYGWAGCWIRFFSAAPSMNAVSYQIVRSRPFDDTSLDPGYYLYRSVVRVDHTFEAAVFVSEDQPIEAGFDITYSGYSTGVSQLGNPGEITRPNKSSILIGNVIDFGIRYYIEDDTLTEAGENPHGMRIIFPADISANLVSNSMTSARASTSYSSASPEALGNRYPEAAEVYLRLIDKIGAEKLLRLEQEGGAGDQWNDIVDQHSKLYRRFIEIGLYTNKS